MARPLLSFGALLVVVLAGCGGGGGHHSDSASALAISAPNTTILPGGTIAFTAVVKGSGTVRWSADGGTITSDGVYTAPTTQGTYTVTATVGDQTATKTVTVTTGVTITPSSAAATPLTIPKSKLFFVDTVAGASDKTVLWSVTDATGAAVAGAIGTDGTFTAPATVGTYTVKGAAKADPTKTTSATVRVVANVNARFTWTGASGTGDLVLALRPDVAPNTAANFVTLIDKGFYDGIKLHRTTTVADDGFGIVQWGDPLTKTLPLDDPSIGTGGPGYTIPFEDNDLQNVQYSLAMARSSSKDSGGSQVYVNLSDNTEPFSTDGKSNYVVFGAVTPGSTAVADALAKGDTITKAVVEAVSL